MLFELKCMPTGNRIEESASYPRYLCIVSGGEDRKEIKGAHIGRQRNSYPSDGECCYVGHQWVSQTLLPMPTCLEKTGSQLFNCVHAWQLR